MIPTSTGAAKAVGLVLPELNGKLDGSSIRVPTPNVSVIDFKFIAKRATTKDEINEAIKRAAEQQLKGILGYTDPPNVSIDFNHDSAFLGLPPRPDQGHGRHLRARHVLVRQRVGLLEPHGRHRRRHGEAFLRSARMAFRTLDQADVRGKRVLVRVDLNVPMENGRVTDATRIERVAADDQGDRREGRQGHPSRPFRPAEGSRCEGFAEAGRRALRSASRQGRWLSQTTASARSRRRRWRRSRTAMCCFSRTPASTPARRRTTRRSSPNSRSSATSTSTTRSRPPTAPTPRPRDLHACFRPCRTRHAERTRRAHQGPRGSGPPGRRHRRRRQGLDQDRPSRKPRRARSTPSSSAAAWRTPSCTPWASKSASRSPRGTSRTPPCASSNAPAKSAMRHHPAGRRRLRRRIQGRTRKTTPTASTRSRKTR